MNFKDFLKEQFRPCIFCYATPEVKRNNPNYFYVISKAWSEVQDKFNDKDKMRIIFPKEDEQLSVLQSDLLSLEEENMRKEKEKIELTSVNLIREFYFKQEYFKRHFFPDLPIGLLIVFSKENPDFNDIFRRFPLWANVRAKSLKVKLHFPSDNIINPLENWQRRHLIPRYLEIVKQIDIDYEEESTIQQRISAALGMQDNPFESSMRRKYYADLCVQRGKLSEAASCYQGFSLQQFSEEATFCSVLCDILADNINQNTLKNIVKIKSRKTTFNQYNLYSLTEFYVRIALSNQPIIALSKLPKPRLEIEKQQITLFRPFLLEQTALFSEKRHFCFYISEAASSFAEIGAINISELCYRAGIDSFYEISWPIVSQPLCLKAHDIIAKNGFSTIDIITNMCRSSSLPFSKEIGELIQRLNIDSPFPCNFCNVKVIDFIAPDFPGMHVEELRDEWKQITERLFGSYKRETFFNYNSMDPFQCCVGEEAILIVQIKLYADISISDIYLLTMGTAEIEQKISDEPSSRIKTYFIKFIPKKTGNLEIYGIGFKWKNVCSLETPFNHSPIRLKVLEPLPKATFTFSPVCTKAIVGQFVKVDAKIKNGSYPLDSLSILIKGNVEASLIDPEGEELFGKTKLKNLEADEELDITVSTHFDKIGKYYLVLLFPYWKKEKNFPPRFHSQVFNFEIFAPPTPKIEYSLSGVQAFSPEYSWALGFTCPFHPNIAGNLFFEDKYSINKHLIVVDGRLSLVDFASVENTEEEFILPKFCEKFVDKSKFYFWYQNHFGIVQTEIHFPETPVSILLKKQENNDNTEFVKYDFIITNLRNEKLTNLCFIFNGNFPFFSGINKKLIKSLDIKESVIIKTHIVFPETIKSFSITLILNKQIYNYSIPIDN